MLGYSLPCVGYDVSTSTGAIKVKDLRATKVIHITHEMPIETLDDLALTAQGGIHYWAVWIDDNQWSEFEEPSLKPTGRKFKLDADLIAKGIEVCSKARPDIWHRIATDVIDGSADIDGCDTIVQFGVFGELVYG